MQAPPSIAAELRKLATVSACIGSDAVRGHGERLQRRARSRPPTTATADDRGPNRREDAADGRPVEHDGRLGARRARRRARRASPSRAAACAGTCLKRERDRDQNRREAGVEAEELDARLARHEHEREDDADAEMREEEEEDGGQRHRSGGVGRAGSGGWQVRWAGVDRAVRDPTCLTCPTCRPALLTEAAC